MLPKQLVVDIFTKQRILSKLGIYTQASKQILPETTQLRYSKRMKTAPQVLLLRAQLFTTGWSSQYVFKLSNLSWLISSPVLTFSSI